MKLQEMEFSQLPQDNTKLIYVDLTDLAHVRASDGIVSKLRQEGFSVVQRNLMLDVTGNPWAVYWLEVPQYVGGQNDQETRIHIDCTCGCGRNPNMAPSRVSEQRIRPRRRYPRVPDEAVRLSN